MGLVDSATTFVTAFAGYISLFTIIAITATIAVLWRKKDLTHGQRKTAYTAIVILLIIVVFSLRSVYLSDRVKVPNLVGMTSGNAWQTLVEKGLECESDLPVSANIGGQSEPAGKYVKIGTKIKLYPEEESQPEESQSNEKFIALTDLTYVDSWNYRE